MQLISLVSLASLLASAHAAVMYRQEPNPHIIDFRGFSGPDCLEGNEGVYTVVSHDFVNGECKSLIENAPNDNTTSVLVGTFDSPCEIRFFETSDCSDAGKALDQESDSRCVGNAEKRFVAFELSCQNHAR
ncbi:hypothetical protein ESCO_000100 [Escovopsis weberi]|uniref:Uncharacterized protein n=1 Tax=Escovopsis weberi TaxID=150374 RepID=A0A0M8MV41_ESCWE|nr:hypothetical protein ESCO_000100 [Escovopsis weberi]